MKKNIAFILALLLVLTCVACGTGTNTSTSSNPSNNASGDNTSADKTSNPADDPKVKLTMASFFASGNPHEVMLNYVFTEAYNRSGGTLEITYYPGGTLCGQADMLDGILNGVADIGVLQIADNGSVLPELSLIEYPGIYFASAPAINGAVMEYIDTYAPAELEGIRMMAVSYGTKGCICSNDGPVHNPDALAGLTIRAGGNMAKSITKFGGVPADIAIADCYESLRTGVVDGIMTLRGAVYTWNLCEVLDYGIDYPLYNNGTVFVMNEDVLNSLTDNQKEALQSAFDDAYEMSWNKFGNDFYKEPAASRLNTEMNEYYYPTDEEIEQFRSKIENIIFEQAATIENGEEILQRWQTLAEKWNELYPSKNDDDPDMYIAINPTTGERLQCGAGTGFEWTLPY